MARERRAGGGWWRDDTAGQIFARKQTRGGLPLVSSLDSKLREGARSRALEGGQQQRNNGRGKKKEEGVDVGVGLR
eukprot:scaffold217227_cov22-Tisochrysis_lutea.AAC.1